MVEDVVKNYPITFNVESDSIVLADESFYSIIDNIIRNAIVHGKTDKIDIITTCKDDICEIRIADYGGDIHVEDNKPNGTVLVIKVKGNKNER